jgi:hypothetical protein
MSQSPEDRAALAEFARDVKAAVAMSQAAGQAAREAMARIAPAIVHSDSGQALRLRALLRNLYSGSGRSDLSDVMTLDTKLRQDFAAVVAGVNCGVCPDAYLRDAFAEVAGKDGVAWFLAGTDEPDPRDALTEALAFCKRGALETSPRSSSERVFARFVASIFLGGEVDLSACNLFDQERRHLARTIFAAFMAGRYGSEEAVIVSEHFDAGE